jgi:hypothetical protein
MVPQRCSCVTRRRCSRVPGLGFRSSVTIWAPPGPSGRSAGAAPWAFIPARLSRDVVAISTWSPSLPTSVVYLVNFLVGTGTLQVLAASTVFTVLSLVSLGGRMFGSCIASMRCRVTDAQSSNQMGSDVFSVEHRFIWRDVVIEERFVVPAEDTPIGAERRTGPFTGVAMDPPSAIPLIIAGPFVDPRADGGMGWMTPVITLPCIGVEDSALARDMLSDEVRARAPVCVVAHPETRLARLAG